MRKGIVLFLFMSSWVIASKSIEVSEATPLTTTDSSWQRLRSSSWVREYRQHRIRCCVIMSCATLAPAGAFLYYCLLQGKCRDFT